MGKMKIPKRKHVPLIVAYAKVNDKHYHRWNNINEGAPAESSTDEPVTHHSDDIYDDSRAQEMLDNDAIDSVEQAFMRGFMG